MHLSRAVTWLLLGTLALLPTGCNLFSSLHSDGKESNAQVLVADGRAALSRGDYAKARDYFNLAMRNNPRNAEARVGYAESYLQAQGFSLGDFANTFLTSIKTSGGTNVQYHFVVPSHWGVSSFAQAEQLLANLISVLDPVVLGQTDGPYAATDVNLNLTVGVFYILHIVASLDAQSSSYTVQNLDKLSSIVAAWGLDPAILNALPSQFLWLVDSSFQQPPLAFIQNTQAEMNRAMARLRVAASHSSAAGQIQDALSQFNNWQTLFSQ